MKAEATNHVYRPVNVTLVLDKQPLTRAPLKAEALGKSLDELIGELLQRTLAEGDEQH